MNKIVELPLIDPVYSTYQDGIFSACIVENPTIRNYYLNELMILACNRRFLSGYTSPGIRILDTYYTNNPYLIKRGFDMRYLKGYANYVIRNLLDDGFYVYFWGVDDYYVEGKSWYKQRHFNHDGAICGYNREDKTYCIYAYDSRWINRKFWTPQKSFNAGLNAMFKKGCYGFICGMKPCDEIVEFSPQRALSKIAEYLDSNMEKYSENCEGEVYGIVVHDYIAKYVEKLYDGSIPYERMDRRVFRMIWEHKKIMFERIQCIENALSLNDEISKQYEPLVKVADTIRLLYASHHSKRRDSVLPIIQNKLLYIKKEEERLLKLILEKARGIENETVGLS